MKINKPNNIKSKLSLQNLLVAQIILTTLSLFYNWSLQYGVQDGKIAYLNRISFISEDKPWMPPGLIATPIYGFHYFGDWVLNVGYGSYTDPYNLVLALPSQFPPLGLLTYGLVGVLGFKASYFVFLVITSLIWINLINYFLSRHEIFHRVVALVFIVILTTPSIIAFDRGGVQLFCIGLLGLCIKNIDANRKSRSLIYFVIAVSLKPYLLSTLLFILLRVKKPRTVLKDVSITLLTLALTNIAIMILYSNSLISGIKNYLIIMRRFAGDTLIPFVQDSCSFMGFISKTNEIFFGTESSRLLMEKLIGLTSSTIAVIYISGLVYIASRNQVPNIISVPLILATASLIAPPSGNYTLTWASLAFLFILSRLDEYNLIIKDSKILRVNFYMIVLALFAILTPYFGMLNGVKGTFRSHPGGYFYVPLILFSFVLSIYLCAKEKKNSNIIIK